MTSFAIPTNEDNDTLRNTRDAKHMISYMKYLGN